MGRIASLDIAKGVFIILMTFSHIGLVNLDIMNDINRNWFYLFKMPGFYIISGYLMYASISSSQFIFRKIDGIYKPCVVLIVMLVLLGLWLDWRAGHVELPNLKIFFPASSTDYLIKGLDVMIFPSWFVLNLPFSFAFCKGLHYAWANRLPMLFSALLMALLLLNAAPSVWGVNLPFKLESCLYAVLYLFTGFFLKRLNVDLTSGRLFVYGALIFVVLRLLMPDSVLSLDLYQNIYGNFLVTYIASVSAVVALIAAFSHFSEKSVLAWFFSLCSRHSLYILVLHIPIYNMLKPVMHLLPFHELLIWAGGQFVTIVLCILTAVMFKKLDPKGLLFQARPKPTALPISKLP